MKTVAPWHRGRCERGRTSWNGSVGVARRELAWSPLPAERALRIVDTPLELLEPSFHQREAIIARVVLQPVRGPLLIHAQADAEGHEAADGHEEGDYEEGTHGIISEWQDAGVVAPTISRASARPPGVPSLTIARDRPPATPARHSDARVHDGMQGGRGPARRLSVCSSSPLDACARSGTVPRTTHRGIVDLLDEVDLLERDAQPLAQARGTAEIVPRRLGIPRMRQGQMGRV